MPAAVRTKLYAQLVEQPYAHVVAWVTQRLGEVPGDIDVYALTLILVESMSAYVSLRMTFGRAPDDIDDDRYVETSVALAADTLERAASGRTGAARSEP